MNFNSDIFIKDRADPFVCDGGDGFYYFTASYPMYGKDDANGYDRIILRRSKTIIGLINAEEKTIWHQKDSKTAFRFIWAPELHKIGGVWYVLFAASGSENNVWDIDCHIIKCLGDDPYNDEWVDIGKFLSPESDSFSFKGFSLDMTYFECNGKSYVAWAQNGGNSNVYIATVDPNEPWKTTSNAMLLTKPEFDWERVRIPVNEGPAVMVENGRVYLAFSASATGPEYCVGLIYADENADLLDIESWTKLPEPVLTSADLPFEYGPGHNSFVKDENGEWLIVYHSRDEKCFKGECGYSDGDSLYDPCRSARIKKVKWDKKGFPVFNK
ncbi:MAG: alpha-N-arabinofuranosidase [Ruminococcaceae bacterium]|nr:alpha-N-arabinofuranosidase [Oscillospiraceae bacterium]